MVTVTRDKKQTDNKATSEHTIQFQCPSCRSQNHKEFSDANQFPSTISCEYCNVSFRQYSSSSEHTETFSEQVADAEEFIRELNEARKHGERDTSANPIITFAGLYGLLISSVLAMLLGIIGVTSILSGLYISALFFASVIVTLIKRKFQDANRGFVVHPYYTRYWNAYLTGRANSGSLPSVFQKRVLDDNE